MVHPIIDFPLILTKVANVSNMGLQWCALENQQSSFYVVNEVTLTGQNPSLKFC